MINSLEPSSLDKQALPPSLSFKDILPHRFVNPSIEQPEQTNLSMFPQPQERINLDKPTNPLKDTTLTNLRVKIITRRTILLTRTDSQFYSLRKEELPTFLATEKPPK